MNLGPLLQSVVWSALHSLPRVAVQRKGRVREDRVAVIAAHRRAATLRAMHQQQGEYRSGELPGYLHRIGSIFAVSDQIERCGACGTFTTAFSLKRSV